MEEFWCRVKSLTTSKLSTVAASALYQIKQVSQKKWERKSLPSLQDFQERAAASKKSKMEYGIVEGQYMYRFRILFVAGSKQAVEENGTRLHSEKRLSTSETKIPLKYFISYEEQQLADNDEKKNKKLPKKKKAKGVNKEQTDKLTPEETILKEYEWKKNAKMEESTNVRREIDFLVDNSVNGLVANGGDKETVDVSQESGKKPTEDGEQPSIVHNLEDSGSKHDSDIDKGKGDQLQNTVPQCTATNGDDVESLKLKIKELEKKLTASKEKDNAKKQSKASAKLLAKIAAQTQQISEKVGNISGVSCRLKDLKMAVPAEEDITIPDGHIYIGGEKKFIKTEVVAAIDEMYGGLNQKGEALFKAIVGESLGGFAKGKKGIMEGAKKRLILKLIPTDVVSSMSVILRKGFTWLEGETPSHDSINEFFRKQPGEVRRRDAKKAKSSEKRKKKEDHKKDNESSGSDSGRQDNRCENEDIEGEPDMKRKKKSEDGETDNSSSGTESDSSYVGSKTKKVRTYSASSSDEDAVKELSE